MLMPLTKSAYSSLSFSQPRYYYGTDRPATQPACLLHSNACFCSVKEERRREEEYTQHEEAPRSTAKHTDLPDAYGFVEGEEIYEVGGVPNPYAEAEAAAADLLHQYEEDLLRGDRDGLLDGDNDNDEDHWRDQSELEEQEDREERAELELELDEPEQEDAQAQTPAPVESAEEASTPSPVGSIEIAKRHATERVKRAVQGIQEVSQAVKARVTKRLSDQSQAQSQQQRHSQQSQPSNPSEEAHDSTAMEPTLAELTEEPKSRAKLDMERSRRQRYRLASRMHLSNNHMIFTGTSFPRKHHHHHHHHHHHRHSHEPRDPDQPRTHHRHHEPRPDKKKKQKQKKPTHKQDKQTAEGDSTAAGGAVTPLSAEPTRSPDAADEDVVDTSLEAPEIDTTLAVQPPTLVLPIPPEVVVPAVPLSPVFDPAAQPLAPLVPLPDALVPDTVEATTLPSTHPNLAETTTPPSSPTTPTETTTPPSSQTFVADITTPPSTPTITGEATESPIAPPIERTAPRLLTSSSPDAPVDDTMRLSETPSSPVAEGDPLSQAAVADETPIENAPALVSDDDQEDEEESETETETETETESDYSSSSESSSSEDDPSVLVMKDLFAGTCGGILQVISGHPLDTIKVRLQTQNIGADGSFKYSGAMNCLRTTIKEEGFRGLYKGMSSPLAGMAALNAVLFTSYGQAKQWLQEDPDDELTVGQAMLAGTVAGFAQTFIISPTELIKARMQVQFTDGVRTKPEYSGTVDCVRKTWQRNGMRGLFAGMSGTIYRELPAYAVCFGVYEYLRILWADEDDEISTAALLMAGGLAGMACWTVSYPADVIVNRLRVEPTDRPSKFRKSKWLLDGGFFDCLKQTIRKEGARTLWKGYAPCMIRAFIANAASFFGYEGIRAFLD